MKSLFQILALVVLTKCLEISQKNEDEGRPYEFGFTINGQQHRHEKKDERGIIQGEFGFITADGIYHVTVYATDENGNFKILSMRNLRISAPLDGSPFTGEISPEANKYRKQANLPLLPEQKEANPLSIPQNPPPQQVAEVITTPKSQEASKFTLQPTVKTACASCGYVTTSPKPPPGEPSPKLSSQEYNAISEAPRQYENSKTNGGPGNQQTVPNLSGEGHFLTTTRGFEQSKNQPNNFGPYKTANGPQSTNYRPFGQDQTGPEQGGATQNQTGEKTANISQNTNYRPFGQDRTGPGQGGAIQNQIGGNTPGGNGQNPDSPEANPLQIPGRAPPPPEVSSLPPVSVSDGVIHVGGDKKQDIPIEDKFPGMQDGLPEGIEEKDITNLLYKFNYIVGFHGHYEKGLKNGAKIGGYFVNGRDGISRIVTYVADENGYRAKVKFVNLGLDSEDTPKPETEKTFGLKSFEFVWYPL